MSQYTDSTARRGAQQEALYNKVRATEMNQHWRPFQMFSFKLIEGLGNSNRDNKADCSEG